LFTPEIDSCFRREAQVWSPTSVSPQLVNSGKEVFRALLWRKPPKFAEPFIEALNLLILFDNKQEFYSYNMLYYISDDL
jgi:hypothetical protein